MPPFRGARPSTMPYAPWTGHWRAATELSVLPGLCAGTPHGRLTTKSESPWLEVAGETRDRPLAAERKLRV
jgi:hypothetical protein